MKNIENGKVMMTAIRDKNIRTYPQQPMPSSVLPMAVSPTRAVIKYTV